MLDLMKLQPATEHPHGLSDAEFDVTFTQDKPVIFAYHGYPYSPHSTGRAAGPTIITSTCAATRRGTDQYAVRHVGDGVISTHSTWSATWSHRIPL